ncbi:hypothetical protein Pan241w_43160 [Gimesia alba]|uniref:Uncharacterized protein n=1 Tax=Gimesia alba TaxID=2527973 RepID=A0A517RK11_9PLAN|nr:hypothetical protein [Gimesia alba]QDT44208.1 hypothetical protein Pan241w_43160 [Gimesia alba]
MNHRPFWGLTDYAEAILDIDSILPYPRCFLRLMIPRFFPVVLIWKPIFQISL